MVFVFAACHFIFGPIGDGLHNGGIFKLGQLWKDTDFIKKSFTLSGSNRNNKVIN